MIAGQHAQTAGINRQRFVHTKLRREIGHAKRRFLFRQIRVRFAEPPCFLQVSLKRFVDPGELSAITIVGGGGRQLLLVDDPQQLNRIVVHLFPEVTVQPAKQFHRVGMPNPPEVVCHLQQWLQLGGQFGEYLKCL